MELFTLGFRGQYLTFINTIARRYPGLIPPRLDPDNQKSVIP